MPSTEELAHDYLWRVHQRVPRKGEIGVFNRSHYEDVLVVRVHGLVPKSVWCKRYDQINDWERMLSESGTTIVKFFLTIDRDEQRQRFQARYDDPSERWKFSMGDLEERKLWDDYQAAFEDALSKTSTSWAPWYVIPANHKWFRNLAVSSILADTLAGLKPAYPAGARPATGSRHRVARPPGDRRSRRSTKAISHAAVPPWWPPISSRVRPKSARSQAVALPMCPRSSARPATSASPERGRTSVQASV